jgi:hypothetical protein
MNVPNRTAYVRMLSEGVPTRPFSIETIAPRQANTARIAELIARSDARYGRPRVEIEAEIKARYQKEAVPPAEPFATM